MKFYAEVSVDLDVKEPQTDADYRRLAEAVNATRETIVEGIRRNLFAQAYRVLSVKVQSEGDRAFAESMGRRP